MKLAAAMTEFSRVARRQLLGANRNLNPLELAKALFESRAVRRRLSIGWFLCGDRNVGSSRIGGFNLHDYLRSHGASSFVLHSPAGYVEALEISDSALEAILRCRFDVVIFQRVHQGRARELIRRLKAAGTTTVFFLTDVYETEAHRETDYLFAISDEFKGMLVRQGIEADRIFVVTGAIETPQHLIKARHANAENQPIRIAWIGAMAHWNTLIPIRRVLAADARLANYRLVTISNHPEADIAWNLRTVWNDVLSCDIGIVPVDLDSPAARVKTNNRVAAFKALAMPVICSRLPVYEEVIVHGKSGFFADTEEDWATHLLALGDPDLRREMGQHGREALFREYGIDHVGASLHALLRRLARRP